MIKYFKEILETLKKIEKHLKKLSDCIRGDEVKVNTEVAQHRRY